MVTVKVPEGRPNLDGALVAFMSGAVLGIGK
jgi:hypothetical protein